MLRASITKDTQHIKVMNNNKSLLALVLFPFAPFLSFLTACTNLRNRANGIVFVLFYSLFGYCHTFNDIRSDSYRKAEIFKYYFSDSLSDILRQFSNGEIMDIYESILFSVLKSFTNDPHIMMMVVGFVCGFFLLLIIKRILADIPERYNKIALIVVFMLIVLISPPLMGGIRNITSLAIFAYSAIRFLIDKKNIWIIGILVAPLIHFSVIILSVAAIIARIVHIKWKILFWPVIFTCFISMFLDTSSWSGISNVIDEYIGNESIVNRASTYEDEETNINFSKSLTTRIIAIQQIVMTIYMIFALISIRRQCGQLKIGKYSNYLLYLMMLFLLIGYILTSYSVVGSRYLKFGFILFYIVCLNLYTHNPNNTQLNHFIIALPIVNIGNIAWVIYNSYSVVGLEIFYLPLPLLLL